MQLFVSKALVPLIGIINESGLSNGDKAGKEIMSAVYDAQRLVIAAFNYGNQVRKEIVRDSVRDGRTVKLCSWDTPVGESLLFADIHKRVLEIDSTSRFALGGKRKRQSQRYSGRKNYGGSSGRYSSSSQGSYGYGGYGAQKNYSRDGHYNVSA